jgi:hypothetical protein
MRSVYIKGVAKAVVKYSDGNNTKWVEYKLSHNRDLEKVRQSFVKDDRFRFALIYQYNEKTKQRGNQIATIKRDSVVMY